jgi:hypothetical protein
MHAAPCVHACTGALHACTHMLTFPPRSCARRNAACVQVLPAVARRQHRRGQGDGRCQVSHISDESLRTRVHATHTRTLRQLGRPERNRQCGRRRGRDHCARDGAGKVRVGLSRGHDTCHVQGAASHTHTHTHTHTLLMHAHTQATDYSGNSATCEFNVTVRDAEAPRFLQCPTLELKMQTGT